VGLHRQTFCTSPITCLRLQKFTQAFISFKSSAEIPFCRSISEQYIGIASSQSGVLATRKDHSRSYISWLKQPTRGLYLKAVVTFSNGHKNIWRGMLQKICIILYFISMLIVLLVRLTHCQWMKVTALNCEIRWFVLYTT